MLNPIIKAFVAWNEPAKTKAVDVLMSLEKDLTEIGFEPSTETELALKELNTMFDSLQLQLLPLSIQLKKKKKMNLTSICQTMKMMRS